MGFVTDMFSSGGTDSLDRADQYFANIDPVDYDRMIEEMRLLQESGQVTPEEYKAVMQDPSLLMNYSADPRLKEAQMKALTELESIATEGGLTTADKAKINEINRNVATADKGRRDAIIQRAAERGVGGSGLEIASQMTSAQDAADRAAREGEAVAARAEERALDALMKSGELGGAIRSQDFSEKERIAAAQDAINRFNAGQRTDQNKGNVGVRNQAKYANRDYRTGIQQDVNNLRRNRFQDDVTIAGGRAGVAQNAANMEEQRRKAGQQTLTGLGSAALGLFA